MAEEVNPIDGIMRSFGEEAPGGCDECDATLTVERVSEMMAKIVIQHDETCPRLQRLKRNTS